jgi:UDP-glucose 4-epimerase
VSEGQPVIPRAVREAIRGSRALVTGGAGFIGSHLVDALAACEASAVHIVDDLSLGRRANLESALAHEGVQLTIGDAADLDMLERLAAEWGPFDHCYNLAVIPLPHSLVSPRENVDRNVAMSTAVCELGRRGAFGRLVQYSSSEVYGTALAAPMDEVHPLRPHTPYAAAKAATDLVALSYATTFALNVVVVRPFNTYGERQNDGSYAGLIPAVVRAVLAGEPVVIDGDGEQTRDMSYVGDTVAGTLIAAVASDVKGATLNLGSGEETSVNELVRILLNALGHPDHPVVHGPARPGDVRRLLADTSRARERLGHAPSMPLTRGLERTVAWYLARATPEPARAGEPGTGADDSPAAAGALTVPGPPG